MPGEAWAAANLDAAPGEFVATKTPGLPASVFEAGIGVRMPATSSGEFRVSPKGDWELDDGESDVPFASR
ncbi:MAG: hypothetical protein NTY64_19285, partial [Deltaproteobacteria bacterium]|nr:hypothetical protein [Deltaproteobacteria bacterium]